jgi:hypothetical protein
VLDYCLGKNEPALQARAIQLISRFSKEAIGSPAFLEAGREAVVEAFGRDQLSAAVSEVFLFKAVCSRN